MLSPSTGAAFIPSVFIRQTCDANRPCASHLDSVENSAGVARPVQKRSAAAAATVYVCVARLKLFVPSPRGSASTYNLCCLVISSEKCGGERSACALPQMQASPPSTNFSAAVSSSTPSIGPAE
eukprot:COSAG01_NODE_8367_length_2812_cov_1.819388_3_plen_124_part_00